MRDAPGTPSTDEADRLAAVGSLLGSLLLEELTPERLRALDESGAVPVLCEMGLLLPAPDDAPALENSAAEYFATFLSPEGFPPPVQSLVAEGVYEGAPAASMREIAESASLVLDADAAHGAPVDHLGCQLLLWSALEAADQDTARQFAERHLAWALPLLARIPPDSFYGRLAEIVAEFIRSIC